MREISEFKLMSYYLVYIFENTGMASIKYEDVKALTEKVLKRLTSNYNLQPINKKSEIVKSMISKGLFKVSSTNGKQSFSQVRNFEIMKHIFAYYTCDGTLLFKLQPALNINDELFSKIKNVYMDNVDLSLKTSINAELNNYIRSQSKSHPQIRAVFLKN